MQKAFANDLRNISEELVWSHLGQSAVVRTSWGMWTDLWDTCKVILSITNAIDWADSYTHPFLVQSRVVVVQNRCSVPIASFIHVWLSPLSALTPSFHLSGIAENS